MRRSKSGLGLAAFAGMLLTLRVGRARAAEQVRTESGIVEGARTESAGVRVFRGIPLAAPPVGELRWKAPQPVKSWNGLRKATEFGSRCMQAPIFSDMIFRDRANKPMSEDCLYLNVWTPAKSDRERLAAQRKKDPSLRFWPSVDGYVLPKDVAVIFAEGRQSHVALLAGWNADEASWAVANAMEKPTAQNFAEQIRKRAGERAAEVLKLYPARADEEARRSAIDLASDLFIVYITWEWLEKQNKTGQAAVYGYVFEGTPPASRDAKVNGVSPKELGARHACEIEYVFGALKSQPNPWEPVDFKISDAMASYWANFTKMGDPNGPGLEKWPAYGSGEGHPMMHFGEKIQAAPQMHRERYEYWDSVTRQSEAR